MKDKLHPRMLDALAMLPEHLPVALLARHSIREQPQNGFAGYDVPLTEEGLALAAWLGRNLGSQRELHSFHSSPVPRCMDTARAMANGAQIDEVVIHSSSLLVEPGSYVLDIEKVAGLFFKLGPVAFASKHLKNEVRGLKPPGLGVSEILESLRASLGEAGSLSVHVTHDTILASFIYHLVGIDELEQDHWPWMMEGAFLWFQSGKVHWIWRGESGARDL